MYDLAVSWDHDYSLGDLSVAAPALGTNTRRLWWRRSRIVSFILFVLSVNFVEK